MKQSDRVRCVEDAHRQMASGGCCVPVLMAIAIALAFGSCCTYKPTVVVKDSVRVEVRERVIKIPDTVWIEIPAQSAERTTADSTSHLENDYAESNARINRDGTLYHDLATKPQSVPAKTDKDVIYRDSIVYRDRDEKHAPEAKVVEVPRKKSWFDKTQQYGFWLLLALWGFKYRNRILKAGMKFLE